MVKGQCLKCTISAVIIFTLQNARASAWLPKIGKYNVIMSYSCIDSNSRAMRNKRGEIFNATQDLIYALASKRDDINQMAQEREDTRLFNSEIREIQNIDGYIATLEQDSSELMAFNDEQFAYIDIEYGARENQSFGAKVSYQEDVHPNFDTRKIANDALLYYKYKLYDQKNRIATIQNKINLTTHSQYNHFEYWELALNLGNSRKIKNHQSYFEIDVAIRQYHNISRNIALVFTMQGGMKFANGFTISNFTQYNKMKSPNSLYGYSIYDQISISQDVSLNKCDKSKLYLFTIQIGYFWKGSLKNNLYTVSGPVFSIFFDM